MTAKLIVFLGYLASLAVVGLAVAQTIEPLIGLLLIVVVLVLTIFYMGLCSDRKPAVTNIVNQGGEEMHCEAE